MTSMIVLALQLLGAVTLAQAQTNLPPWTMERLPDTGQTRRYASVAGDDSLYSIHPPAYRANGNGVVTDLVTGLDWQQTDGGEMTWQAAVAYCDALTLGGREDWRLPSAQELFTIQNHGVINPAIDAVFTRTPAEYWWSIDARVDDPGFVWASNAGGGIGAHRLNETRSAGGAKAYHARCVRHSAVGPGVPNLYADRGDGTVMDNRTGLIWTKAEVAPAVNWEEALMLAAAADAGGYRDWRLPNIKELRSLQSDRAMRPVIDASAFPNTANALFWSSTTQIGQQGVTAWTLDFGTGVVSYNNKASDRLHVRLVRGGAGPRVRFVQGIRNAASFAEGPVAPGGLLRMAVTARPDAIRIGGIEVTDVEMGDEDQLTVVVPEELLQDGRESASVELRAADSEWSPPYRIGIAAAAPGVFTAGGGKGPALIVDATEETLTIAATGLSRDGEIGVLVGEAPCDVVRVEGPQRGVWRVTLRRPAAELSGSPLLLTSGGAASQSGVTIEIP